MQLKHIGRKEELNHYRENNLLDISVETLQSYLDCLKRKDVIEREYKQACQDYDEAIAKQSENKAISDRLPVKVEKAEDLLRSIEADKELLSNIAQRFPINPSSDYDLNFYYNSTDKIESFAIECGIQKKILM